MTNLPNPFTYIFASESFSLSGERLGVTIFSNGDVLVGSNGSKKVWIMNYIDRSKGTCTFSDESRGLFGVKKYSDETNYVVGRVQETQEWMLKKAVGGFSISQVVNGEELFWHVDNEGGEVMVTPSSHGIQSWVLESRG